MSVPAWMLLFVLLIAVAGGQLLPENACPQYFQYVNDAFRGLQGEVTLPGLTRGRNRIDLRLTQRGDHDASAVGGLSPYPDESAARSGNGPSRFRLYLRPDPATGLLPKLSRLSYNDQLLCSASEYGPPNSFFNRFYEILISGSLAPLPTSSSGFIPFPRDGFDVDIQSIFFPSSGSSSNDVWSTFTSNRRPSTQVFWQTPVNTFPDSRRPVTAAPAPLPPREPVAPIPSATLPPSPDPTAAAPAATPPPSPPSAPPSAPPPAPPTAPTSVRFNPRSPSAAEICGEEGSTTPFIHNGQEFPRGRYPWLSAIFHKTPALEFKCGGSLLSASIVITAAHCVHKMSETRVVVGLGRYDLLDYAEDGAEMRNVRKMVWHPEYNTRVLSDADIALVTMVRPVVFNDIIGPICLWTAEASTTVATSGSIAGWGTDEAGNLPTKYPRVVEARIASATDCASTWRATAVTDRTLCAGNMDGSGPCLGDSGGGLMVRQGSRWLLRGIVSSGERDPAGSCKLTQYVLYCDLAKHLEWINDNIG
ncbi:hypothetical protein KR054_007644 [Drosophila jambulina]|nr:hypothetical protein KR054_007644 [Drosophila jambulina]